MSASGPAPADVVDGIIARYGDGRGSLIAILDGIQKEGSFLSREALERVAGRLDLPLSQVFGVATFYRIFSLAPRGKRAVKVCLGTACHVKGAGLILERLKRDLGVDEGGTTPDGAFTLETVRCVGCCSIAPVVMVDETAHGRLLQESIPKLLGRYRKPAQRPPARPHPGAARRGGTPARKSPTDG